MNGLKEFVTQGGPVILALIGLSVLLYQRCFHLLFLLGRNRRLIARLTLRSDALLSDVYAAEDELREAFRQQRLAIGAMITAAPLLGLLGTVMGMVAAFDSLSAHGSQRSMEGLAQGISEVLIATESGLAVAIPAVLLLYVAHRQMEKGIQKLTSFEAELRERT